MFWYEDFAIIVLAALLFLLFKSMTTWKNKIVNIVLVVAWHIATIALFVELLFSGKPTGFHRNFLFFLIGMLLGTFWSNRKKYSESM